MFLWNPFVLWSKGWWQLDWLGVFLLTFSPWSLPPPKIHQFGSSSDTWELGEWVCDPGVQCYSCAIQLYVLWTISSAQLNSSSWSLFCFPRETYKGKISRMSCHCRWPPGGNRFASFPSPYPSVSLIFSRASANLRLGGLCGKIEGNPDSHLWSLRPCHHVLPVHLLSKLVTGVSNDAPVIPLGVKLIPPWPYHIIAALPPADDENQWTRRWFSWFTVVENSIFSKDSSAIVIIKFWDWDSDFFFFLPSACITWESVCMLPRRTDRWLSHFAINWWLITPAFHMSFQCVNYTQPSDSIVFIITFAFKPL